VERSFSKYKTMQTMLRGNPRKFQFDNLKVQFITSCW